VIRRTLALIALASLPGAAGAQPLSRADAVAQALANNTDVRKSQQQIVALRGRGREALADALPELKMSGTALRYRDPSLLNSSSFDAFPPELRSALRPIPANLFEGLAQLNQTLWSFKLGAGIRAAKLAVVLGEEQQRAVSRSVALLAIRAYNDYLLDLEKVKVAEKSVRQREAHVELARNRRASGVATDLDVLRLEVSLENQRALLERIRGEAEYARAALNAVMVRPIDSPVEPTDSLERSELDVPLAEAVQEAIANRAEVKAADLIVRVNDQLVTVEKAERLPRLDLNAYWGYSVRQPRNFFTSDFTRWNAAVTLGVPIFDGFRAAGRIAQAQAQREQAAQDRIAVENRIRLEAKDATDQLATAGRVLRAADLNVTQAQKALDMTQANYALGAATPLDVLDIQAALVLAESVRLEALHAQANARATLRWVMGRDPLDGSASVSNEALTKAGSE
jgi:HAE1 family hydrophobic/amphiphilic exporter-1